MLLQFYWGNHRSRGGCYCKSRLSPNTYLCVGSCATSRGNMAFDVINEPRTNRDRKARWRIGGLLAKPHSFVCLNLSHRCVVALSLTSFVSRSPHRLERYIAIIKIEFYFIQSKSIIDYYRDTICIVKG